MTSALERAMAGLASLHKVDVQRFHIGDTHLLEDCTDRMWSAARDAIRELGDCHGLHNMGPDFRCTRCGKDSREVVP